MVHKGARVEWTDNTGVAGAAAAIPKVAPVISAPAIPVSEAPPKISETNSELTPSARYRNALGNVCLALLFFTALIPTKPNYHSPLANDIWLAGAVLMGVLSLVRVPARSAMVNP